MQYIPASRIDRELAKLTQIPVPYNLREYPYPELGRRKLELMIHILLRRGIDVGWYHKEFNRVEMASGLTSSGRINVLFYKEQIAGVALIAHRSGPCSAPVLAREVIRFLLLCIGGLGISFERSNFRIFFVAPEGVQDKALVLAEDFNSLILKESRLAYWVQEVLEYNAQLAHLSYTQIQEELEDVLGKIDVELVLPEHLDFRLNDQPDIKSAFFGVEMVTSEQVLKKIVSEFNVKALDEQEASGLLERLEKVPEENRMGVGLINFFGYHREFLQSISHSEKLREIMIKGAEFKTEIDFAVVDFLHDKATLYTQVLLGDAPQVGDLAKLALMPWVYSRFVIKYVKNANSEILTEIVRSGKRKDFYQGADIDQIKADLLSEVRELDEDQVADIYHMDAKAIRRREMLLSAKKAYRSEEALSEKFSEDWEDLKQVRSALEKKMLLILPKSPTIVIEDLGALQNDSRFARILQRFRNRISGAG